MSETQSVQGSVETALPPRPFYKRTEWWLTIIAIVFGGLLGSGLLGVDNVATHLMGMAVAALASVGYTIGRTIAKAAEGLNRPGWKTSEFWGALASGGIVAFQGTDILQHGGQGEAILSAILTALPPLVYAIGRGKMKADALFLMLLVAIALPSCATWEKESRAALGELHAVIKVSTSGGQRFIGDVCTERARACRDDRREAEARGDRAATSEALACQPLVACHSALQRFDTAMIAGQLGVADGLAAVSLGQAAAARDLQAIIARVRALIDEGKRTVAELGGRL